MKKITKWIIGGAAVVILGTGLTLGHVFRKDIKDWISGLHIEKPGPVDPKPPIQLTCMISFEIHRPDGVDKESQEVETGYELELPRIKDMEEIEGYVARYFYVTGSGFSNKKMTGGQTITITSDTKITVTYEKIIQVGFEIDGNVEFQDVIEGDSPLWKTPSKIGMNFDGWTLDGETVINSNYKVTEPVIFKAMFSYKYYTVEFVLSDTMRLSCNYRSDNQVYVPAPLQIEGKDCLGWTKDGENVFDFNNVIIEDTTFHPLYADQSFVETLPFAIENGEITGYFGNDSNVVIPSSYSLDNRGNIIEGNDFQIVKIRDFAFRDSNMVSIEIMPGIISIGDQAFYNCFNLERVIIHEGLTSIGNLVFAECKNLTSIELPSTINELTGFTFSEIDNLQNIQISEDNPSYKSEGSVILTKDGSHLVFATKDAVIPASVNVIDNYAYVYSKVKELVLPDCVTTIEENAFMGCIELTSLTLSENFQFDWQSQCFLQNMDKFKKLVIKNKIENASNLIHVQSYQPRASLINVYVPDEYLEDYINAFMYSSPIVVNTLSSLETGEAPTKHAVLFRSPSTAEYLEDYNCADGKICETGNKVDYNHTAQLEGYKFLHWVRQDPLTMEEVEVIEDIENYVITENTIFKAIFAPIS